MTKVVAFPVAKQRRYSGSAPALPQAAVARAVPPFRWLKLVVLWAVCSLVELCRVAGVTVLVALRPLVFAALRPSAGFLLIAFLVSVMVHPANTHVPLAFGTLAFCAFLVMYLYDAVLMALTGYRSMHVLD